MGLYVSHLKNLPYHERSLYVYLLDYGWPDGPYEKVFRTNFPALSQRASETGAIIVASHNGIHFANEVLSWHNVCGMDADQILPAILITKTHPSYFVESTDDMRPAGEGLGDVVLIPLKSVCTTVDDFARVIGSVFSDLEKGLELRNFQVSEHDHSKLRRSSQLSNGILGRIGRSLILQPNFSGVGVDLKSLFR